MTRSAFPVRALQAFDRSYDTTRQDSAKAARVKFLEKFPLAQLGALRLQDYVIGTQQATFCTYHIVEGLAQYSGLQSRRNKDITTLPKFLSQLLA
jgi:hypothetical protein